MKKRIYPFLFTLFFIGLFAYLTSCKKNAMQLAACSGTFICYDSTVTPYVDTSLGLQHHTTADTFTMTLTAISNDSTRMDNFHNGLLYPSVIFSCDSNPSIFHTGWMHPAQGYIFTFSNDTLFFYSSWVTGPGPESTCSGYGIKQ